MKFLKWLGYATLAIAAVAAVGFATRSNPIGPVAGRQVTGNVVEEPVSDWSFTDEFQQIAVETRPAAPHSVTTICFSHDGALYVPASNASAKSWPYYFLADPRVRVKIGDEVYPGRATRVTDEALRPALIAAARAKYDIGEDDGPPLEEVWVFRIESAPIDVAAAPSPAPEASTPSVEDIRAAAERVVAAADRTPADREVDARRQPVEFLSFAGVTEGMRVADLGAGNFAGWRDDGAERRVYRFVDFLLPTLLVRIEAGPTLSAEPSGSAECEKDRCRGEPRAERVVE